MAAAKKEPTLADVAKDVATIKRLVAMLAGADAKPQDRECKFIPKNLANHGVRKGQKFSTCPPAFLSGLAGTLEWMATKEEAEGRQYNGKPTAPQTRETAKIAKAWALYNELHGPSKDDVAPAFDEAAAQHEKAAYGTSGWGANAKYVDAKDASFTDDGFGDDSEIPF